MKKILFFLFTKPSQNPHTQRLRKPLCLVNPGISLSIIFFLLNPHIYISVHRQPIPSPTFLSVSISHPSLSVSLISLSPSISPTTMIHGSHDSYQKVWNLSDSSLLPQWKSKPFSGFSLFNYICNLPLHCVFGFEFPFFGGFDKKIEALYSNWDWQW